MTNAEKKRWDALHETLEAMVNLYLADARTYKANGDERRALIARSRGCVASRICSMMDDDEYLTSMHYTFCGTQKPKSEIFYTGGGIWCGIIPLADGTWFSGTLNEHGTIYKTYRAADEMQGEIDENEYGECEFIRYTDDADFEMVLNLWRDAIEAERQGNLSGYCDEWMAENDICREQGTFEYIVNE